ncbi:MAG: hypothetical protein EBY57_05160 [Actinobacteria bacterium]|nr:hypothetical protein [Actinomycetota bacterium]
MKKKALFAAMSAGLLAGTGAGFILGVPGLTSAAGDVETDSIDERSSDGAEDGADGRHGRRKGKGGKMGSPETLATALGVDTETLRSEFAAGKSIADIAAEQGIAIDTVVAALVADLEEHLNEHVADGSLTEDEAAEKLASAEDRISEKVNEVPPTRDRNSGPRRGGQLPAAVLEMLGIDGPALREALSEGKSVADIAEENGVEIGDIVSALVDERAAHLAEHVADGSLTEDEAAEKLEAMEAKITERLNTVPKAGERLRGPKHDGDDEFRRGHHDHADDDAVAEA